MILGIDSFREKFANYTDYYTIIGGTACDILLTEADINVDEMNAVDESEVRLLQMGLPFDRNQGIELLKGIYF